MTLIFKEILPLSFRAGKRFQDDVPAFDDVRVGPAARITLKAVDVGDEIVAARPAPGLHRHFHLAQDGPGGRSVPALGLKGQVQGLRHHLLQDTHLYLEDLDAGEVVFPRHVQGLSNQGRGYGQLVHE